MPRRQPAGASGQHERAERDDDTRTREIARMLGGERMSQTSLAHAREMLGKKAPETSS